MLRLVGLMVVVGLVGGCGSRDGGSGSGTVSESGSESVSESGSESVSESGSESVSESGSESVSESGSESVSESGTTGEPLSCYDATDVSACNAASSAYETCGWLPSQTWVDVGGGVCEAIDVGPTGTCVIDEADDGCGVFAEPSCPDGLTSVWYLEVGLEVGAIEVVSFVADAICESPGGGFQQCIYDEQTSTFTPPECSCACPMGR